jgi:hypothetical protein
MYLRGGDNSNRVLAFLTTSGHTSWPVMDTGENT